MHTVPDTDTATKTPARMNPTPTAAKLAHDRQERAVGDGGRISDEKSSARLFKLGFKHLQHVAQVPIVLAHLLAQLCVSSQQHTDGASQGRQYIDRKPHQEPGQ